MSPAGRVSFVLAVLCLLPATAKAVGEVRIGLWVGARSVRIGPGPCRVVEGRDQGRVLDLRASLVAAPGSLGIKFNGKHQGQKLVVAPVGEADGVRAEGRLYRGRLELRRTRRGLTVVNIVSVEDYVRGILVREMSARWPLEALKAQAVASRTYVLKNRGRHGRDGFDLCATDHCQVYGGRSDESPSTDQAVAATRDEVVVDGKQRLVNAVFHACCGGSTEAAQNVWREGPSPAIRPIRCRWCRESPHFHWVAKIKSADLSRGLRDEGADVGEVKNLSIVSRSASGRVHRIRVYGTKGYREISGHTFRLSANPRTVRSTLWTGLSRDGNNWRVHGAGWGHGVGLCQWGAENLARQGMSHRSILRYYYQGAKLLRRKDVSP
jgi:stage II sporulation protein D